MLLVLLASVAAVQTIWIILLLLRRPVYIEPENSHPGRVLPTGVPIGHALKPAPEPADEEPRPDRYVPSAPRCRLPIGDPKDRLRELLGQPAPQILITEQALLGAMIFEQDQIPVVMNILRDPGMFSAPRHVLIYQAILRLHLESMRVDLVTLRDELAWNGIFDYVGGPMYLMELVESVPNSANAGEYARILRDHFYRRIA